MTNKISSHFVSEINRNKSPLFRQKILPATRFNQSLKVMVFWQLFSYLDKVVDDRLMALEASGSYSFTWPFEEVLMGKFKFVAHQIGRKSKSSK